MLPDMAFISCWLELLSLKQWRVVTARQGVRDWLFPSLIFVNFRAFVQKSTKICEKNAWLLQFSREGAKISWKLSPAHPDERLPAATGNNNYNLNTNINNNNHNYNSKNNNNAAKRFITSFFFPSKNVVHFYESLADL